MAFIPPAHSGSWVSFLERPWVAEAGPLVAAPLEAAGQGVGARLEPKELLLRFFGSHAPFLHSAGQHFSVGLGALVFVGLLESIFDRCFLQPQNGGYPARNSLGGRVLRAVGILGHHYAGGCGSRQQSGYGEYANPKFLQNRVPPF